MAGFITRQRGAVLYAIAFIKQLRREVRETITAHAGGGKALATALGYGLNRISVCATAADSVLLPQWQAGAECILINDGAAAAQVFGQGTDTIDAVATATGVPLTNATRCSYYASSVAGTWYSIKGTKSS